MAKIDTTVDRTGERWLYRGQYLWEVAGFDPDKTPGHFYRGRRIYKRGKVNPQDEGITLGVVSGWEMVDEFKNWARRVRKDHGIETSDRL